LAAVAVAAGAATLVLFALNGESLREILFGYSIGGLMLGLSFGAMGGLVASRRSDNPLGWIFLAIALSHGIDSFVTQYAEYALITKQGSVPGGAISDWMAHWTFAPGAGLLATLTLLLFPTGHPPSSRWRWVVWVVALAIALMVVPVAVATWPSRGSLLEEGQPGGAAFLLQGLGLLLVGVAMVVSLVSLVVRFRRAGGTERQQIKWLAYAGALTVLFFSAQVLAGGPERLAGLGVAVGLLLLVVIVPSIPIAVGIAILRYRLYDIDLVINRTLVYGALTVLLGAVYVVGVVGAPRMLPLEDDNDLLVAGSTLAVAALFSPLRRRIQAFVGRRFYRSRYDATRTLEAFGSRLREEVELEALLRDLQGVVRETLQPGAVSVWLAESSLPLRGRVGEG
jgi:hypothetical protein